MAFTAQQSHPQDSHAGNGHAGGSHPTSFEVRVLRQDGPGRASYWERHRIDWEPEMNVISVLQRIAAKATTVDGKRVAPVAWDSNCLEEVCGACTMLINGRVRQACSALVDRLLAEQPGEIELAPMTKFPVLRDLVVDRSRLFRALQKVKAWIPADGYYDQGRGPLMSQEDQESMYPLSECMSCGCCLEACPQYLKIELEQEEGETDEAYRERRNAAHDRGFIGAHAISQVVLFNRHPTGRNNASQRLDALMEEGGIQVCGNSQNCVAVCPKHIPLTTSIGRAGRATTIRMLKKWFGA
jgi:succinate dehydrogenase / fumarate reductase iron-sulfur subunit